MKKRIGYIIFLLVLLMVYIWTNQKMTLWALILATAMMIIVVLLNQIIVKKLKVTYEVVQSSENEKGYIQVEVENRGILPANHIESYIRCDNVVFGSSEMKKFNLSVGGKSREEFKIPVNSQYCGRIDLIVERCRVYDWFDISYRSIEVNKEGCCYAYPEEKYQTLQEIKDGASEGEETTYKHVVGYDVSEILQIREYRKGDSIKNIHWKISAKSGKTMVKELDCPNDNSILVLFDYADKEEKEINNEIISAVCNISNEFMKERKGHTVYRMDTSKERVVDRTVIEPEEFDIMQQELLETEARRCEKNVSDYIMDQSIFRRYAKIIYVKPVNLIDNSGIEELEQCLVINSF